MSINILSNFIVIISLLFIGVLFSNKLKINKVTFTALSSLLFFTVLKLLSVEFVINPIFTTFYLSIVVFLFGLSFSFNDFKLNVKQVSLTIGASLLVSLIAILPLLFIFNITLTTFILLLALFTFCSDFFITYKLFVEGERYKDYYSLYYGVISLLLIVLLPVIIVLLRLNDTANINYIVINLVVGFIVTYAILVFTNKLIPTIYKRVQLSLNTEISVVVALSIIFISVLFSVFLLNSYIFGFLIAGVLLSGVYKEFNESNFIIETKNLLTSIGLIVFSYFAISNTTVAFFTLTFVLTTFFVVLKTLILFFTLVTLNTHYSQAFKQSVLLLGVGDIFLFLSFTFFTQTLLSFISLFFIFNILYLQLIYNNRKNILKFFKKFTKRYIFNFYYFVFIKKASDNKLPKPPKVSLQNHTIIVGYTNIGKTLCKLHNICDLPVVIIDNNYKNMLYLRKKGQQSVYGNALYKNVLKQAKIQTAKNIIITVKNVYKKQKIIDNTKRLNANINIIVLASNPLEVAQLSIKGVKHIVEPTFDLSLVIGKKVFKNLNINFYSRKELIKKVKELYKF